MELLEERIRRDGVVKSEGVLKVDSFLNHQLDIDLFEAMGVEGPTATYEDDEGDETSAAPIAVFSSHAPTPASSIADEDDRTVTVLTKVDPAPAPESAPAPAAAHAPAAAQAPVPHAHVSPLPRSQTRILSV